MIKSIWFCQFREKSSSWGCERLEELKVDSESVNPRSCNVTLGPLAVASGDLFGTLPWVLAIVPIEHVAQVTSFTVLLISWSWKINLRQKFIRLSFCDRDLRPNVFDRFFSWPKLATDFSTEYFSTELFFDLIFATEVLQPNFAEWNYPTEVFRPIFFDLIFPT